MTTVAQTSTNTSRLVGAVLLISGTSIGAAMLALPVTTGRAGLIPSLLVMAAVWLYLVYAALCFVEVQLSMPKSSSNLVSMADYTLGRFGRLFCWAAFLFLLYALNTAYLSGLSSLLQDVVQSISGVQLSKYICVIPILGVFSLLLRGGIKLFDLINRLFMGGLIVAFLALIGVAMPHVTSSHLATNHFEYVIGSLSVVVCAFGYHVVIPTVVTYLDGNIRQLKKAIWIGSGVPLIAYAIWQIATLGIADEASIQSAYAHGLSGAQLLSSITESPVVASMDQSFAFFAIVTSFLGVSLSLFDFLSDGFEQKGVKVSKLLLFGIAFIPPVYFTISSPRIFLTALECAGAYGVVLLLALLPAFMVWRKRYSLRISSSYEAPGGKLALIFFIAISFGLILSELFLKGYVWKNFFYNFK